MGKEKTTQSSNTTQQYTPTAAENQLNQDQADIFRAGKEGAIRNQQAGLDASYQLLTGQALPGYLQGLPGGISPDVQNSIVQESLRQIMPSFQQGGILNSGSAASIASRTAGDIYRNSAEFNLQNLQQLLNIGVGGQAMPLQLGTNTAGQLGGRLAGLRTGTSTGSSTTYGMNPFLKSFQQAAGQAYGNPFQSYGQATGGFR